MTFKEQIMKLQTYKMYEDEDTVYVERKDILKLLEQQPCEDCISREAVLRLVEQYPSIIGNRCVGLMADIKHLPPATPTISEKETVEDCISRQRVLNDLENVIKGSEHPRQVFVFVDECVDYITSVPSVIPKAEWIPCSEKLPEKDGEYLLYGKVVDENEDNHIFIGLYDEGSEGFGWWQDYYDNRTLGFLDSDFTEYASVLAWMPLPESYKAEGEK